MVSAGPRHDSRIAGARRAAASLGPLNWAAHLYVYLALMGLGIAILYLALAGPDRFKRAEMPDGERVSRDSDR